jgi:hypothetical protein
MNFLKGRGMDKNFVLSGNQQRATPMNIKIYLACGVLMVLIFIADLAVPLGVAMGVLYLGVVLLTIFLPSDADTIGVSMGGSILTILGFFYSPPGGELWKVFFNRSLALYAIWLSAIVILRKKRAERKRDEALWEREKALRDVKVLQGLLPICAWCKKIRDDKGYWSRIESYIRDHSEAEFTHGICPECAEKLSHGDQ